jgi:hypothetical protein
MRDLESKLIWLKITLNSYYGSLNNKNFDENKTQLEIFELRQKISLIKKRREKIKRLLSN